MNKRCRRSWPQKACQDSAAADPRTAPDSAHPGKNRRREPSIACRGRCGTPAGVCRKSGSGRRRNRPRNLPILPPVKAVSTL